MKTFKRLKMWHIERTAHVIWLLIPALFQNWGQIQLALGGELLALKHCALVVSFIAAMSFFQGAASANGRLQEKIQWESVTIPTISCSKVITKNVWWGRIFLALFALGTFSLLALASIIWDCLFPFYRTKYREKYPYAPEISPG